MDPSDLRAGLAEKLAGAAPIDAETFNSACFMLSRALEEIEFSVPEAAPLVRRLLRVAGRVVIDTGLAERLAGAAPIDAETFNAACFMLSRALEEIDFSVADAAPLVRRLLRVAGRVVIDTGLPDSSTETWPNTREMAIEWINEALGGLDYEVRPKR